MGRRDKSYHRDLKQQATDRLLEMLHRGAGHSKRNDKRKGMSAKDKIYSYDTYETYRKHIRYFCDYVREHHPECTTITKAERYVNEWLEYRSTQTNKKGEPLSAWTISTEVQAVRKLYGMEADDENAFQAPRRKRQDIKRSRGEAKRDLFFSEANNAELVAFCRGTGLRRRELEELRGKDLISREQIREKLEKQDPLAYLFMAASDEKAEYRQHQIYEDAELFYDIAEYFIFVRNGKGGRYRISPVIGKNSEQIVERMKAAAPDEKVWQYVSTLADIHSYRGDYATAIYRNYARPFEEIPVEGPSLCTRKSYKNDLYVCRKEESKRKLDRYAMELTSKALGHNRIDIVAENYLKGL